MLFAQGLWNFLNMILFAFVLKERCEHDCSIKQTETISSTAVHIILR